MDSESDRINFIVNIGDSSCCDGEGGHDDSRSAQFWTDFYGDEDPSRHFVKLPWYTVFGNHDMGKSYSCPSDGTGTDSHQTHNAADPTWIMPNLTYLVPMPELNIEFIGLCTNCDWEGETCVYANCGNSTACYYNLLKLTAYADTYFVEQYQESTAKTLVGFIHCPVGYLCKHRVVNDLIRYAVWWDRRLPGRKGYAVAWGVSPFFLDETPRGGRNTGATGDSSGCDPSGKECAVWQTHGV